MAGKFDFNLDIMVKLDPNPPRDPRTDKTNLFRIVWC